jgi:hypothetical protein
MLKVSAPCHAERIAERDSQPGVFSEPPDLAGTWSWKVSQK